MFCRSQAVPLAHFLFQKNGEYDNGFFIEKGTLKTANIESEFPI